MTTQVVVRVGTVIAHDDVNRSLFPRRRETAAGQIDQGAGVAFGITPEGSYLGVRVNALESNLLFFRVVKGKRTIIDDVRDVPTPTKTWHTFAMSLRGKSLSAELDDQKRFAKTLDARPEGRVGLWSKADSQVLFDDFKVESIATSDPKPDM